MTIATKRKQYIQQCVDSFNHLLDNGHTRMDIIDLCKDAGYQEDTIIMFLDLIKSNKKVEVIS
jgi:hypothetical protein|tara:strand:+ start:58 stop:246 length:189 start_codon:yes stop_codon:yes gene_type:complete